MRTLRATPWIACLLAGTILLSPISAPDEGEPARLALPDLVALARAGLPETLVLEQVKRLGLRFQPTGRDLEALREAGFSREILAELVREAGLSPSPRSPRETVRIFRQDDGRGGQVLVLTNLDEAGNPIRDPYEEDLPPPAPRPAPPPVESRLPSPPRAAPPPVIVINVDVPPPAFLPGYYPIGAGSIVGPFRYPDRLGFLGYGPGISSPGWFSGLGLNPGNNFGHRPQDRPAPAGFGAFFGPPPR